MKKILAFGLVIAVNIAMNFAVFLVSYNKLATPFLSEEQRVDNADYIMTMTISGFVVVAILSALIIYFCYGKRS